MNDATFAAHPEVTFDNREQIKRVVEWTCARLDSKLASRITFRFNGRMSSTLGKAALVSCQLDFSRVLWPKATPKQRFQNIVHEVCHLIAFEQYGRRGCGHGWAWKHLMVRCGLNPHRCHTVEVKKRRQRGTLEVVCGCPGKVHVLSTRKANRFRNGMTVLTCRTCRQKVTVTPETLKRDVLEHGISPMAREELERA